MSNEEDQKRSIAADESIEQPGLVLRAGETGRYGWLSWIAIALAMLVILLVAGAAFTPIEPVSREEIFEIPKGTWANRMAGNEVEILPDEIRLTLELNDILVLKNLDDVPQIFGPTLMMPGQSFRLPFTMASSYQFACTAHASGQMTITVDPFPDTPWSRLRWRVLQLTGKRSAQTQDSGADADTAEFLPSL